MASAFKRAAARSRDGMIDEARGHDAHRRTRTEWLRCTSETPGGVHGRIVEDGCARCGWKP